MSEKNFDLMCVECPRLASFLSDVRDQHPDYHGRPVPAFGDPDAHLLVVGLAPGFHGANATGRPFTGDHAGILLYQTLYDCGLSTAPTSVSAEDGLELINCRITNAVKCLPPQNKPIGAEINTCNNYLANELNGLPDNSVILALGTIAHNAVIKALGLKQKDYAFGHAQEHALPRATLIDSYHCSRYNTQTRRLTEAMFQDVFKRAKQLLS
jgi:uracil-DNA glycosylase family 4